MKGIFLATAQEHFFAVARVMALLAALAISLSGQAETLLDTTGVDPNGTSTTTNLGDLYFGEGFKFRTTFPAVVTSISATIKPGSTDGLDAVVDYLDSGAAIYAETADDKLGELIAQFSRPCGDACDSDDVPLEEENFDYYTFKFIGSAKLKGGTDYWVVLNGLRGEDVSRYFLPLGPFNYNDLAPWKFTTAEDWRAVIKGNSPADKGQIDYYTLTSSPEIKLVGNRVPGPPSIISVLPGDSQLSVSWDAPLEGAGSPAITGYTAAASPGGATCTTTGATNCVITGLTNGAEYTVIVTATSNGLTGEGSSSSAPTTPSKQPSVRTTPKAQPKPVSALNGLGFILLAAFIGTFGVLWIMRSANKPR